MVGTTANCFILLNDIPTVPKTYHQKVLKEEVQLIAKQSSYRASYISASGFFTVNFGMLGFVFASVTSFIIVVFQFMPN
ncbi:hypothetical protein NQ314_002054 [Rhamnusium bicolor]|uniref:Uncharacterized protein n=1 Tax=Rhamnusium bicolor TaxID=1586634 RepID=A0AAV8ZSA7_9CUCU|nr:hypothetical protein NQ314_002054 [Rhamnusium bicolor]